LTISELPLGTKLNIGVNLGDNNDDILWKKVSDSNDLFAMRSVGRRSFDRREFESPSSAKRAYGNNYFPHSNLFQWLNGGKDFTYTPMHQYDRCPDGVYDGFLTFFDDEELAMLIDREVPIAVPPGSIKEFGRAQTVTCKVSIPSESELVDVPEVPDGEYLPALSQAIGEVPHSNIMTRTGVSDAGHILIYNFGSMTHGLCRDVFLIHPMIRIKPDAPVIEIDSGEHIWCLETSKTHEHEGLLELFRSMIQM